MLLFLLQQIQLEIDEFPSYLSLIFFIISKSKSFNVNVLTNVFILMQYYS